MAKNSEILWPYIPVPTYTLRYLCSKNAPKIDRGLLMDRLEGIIPLRLVAVHFEDLH